jgi:hypothetical protein
VSLVAQIELPAKMHVYAPGVKGYRPVNLVIEQNPDILVHEMQYPKARILNLKAIRERVPVYEGRLRLERDFTVAPGFKGSTMDISVTLEYQACDDQICYIPATIPFTFSLRVEGLERQRVPTELQRKPM